MQRIVYIQTNEDGQPYSVNGGAAAQGFAFLGYEVRFFRTADLPALDITPETIVVGGVGTVHSALEQMGAPPPGHTTIPAILYPFVGRQCWRTTIGEIRSEDRFPVFIKPYEDTKFFKGFVAKSAADLERILSPKEGLPPITDDFPLLAQGPVVFRSEWRVFVVRRRVLGVSHYNGDPLLFPSAGVIRATLGAYQNSPAGYSADFGVADDGRTLLVEINDGYSLGHGGLVSNLYAELLQARWDEITQADSSR